jgi:hypothetical protein
LSSFCSTEKSVEPSAAGYHDLAVDDGGARLDVPGIVRDLPEATGPIVAAAGEDLHLLVGQVDLDAVAVELDFVNPSLAGRHLLDRGCQGRFDEAGEGRLGADRRRFSTLKRQLAKLHATPDSKVTRQESFPRVISRRYGLQ